MQKKFRSLYFLLSSVVITLLHLPFVFAKSAATRVLGESTTAAKIELPAEPALASKSVYDSLQLQFSGLSKQAYEYAKKGFDKLVAQGKILNNSVLSIVDFSQPSSNKRLYVIDLKNYKVLFNTWVAHGRNSGRDMAQSFSNQESSFKSSPGFYLTGNTYRGGHGYSLRLAGLENGINDNAFNRAIVMHGAEYVNPALIASQGYIGRSLGCPAVPVKLATPIINTIKDGSLLFIYHPGSSYLERSTVLS